MAKKRLTVNRRQAASGGWLLTMAVVLLAALACVLLQPPKPAEVAALFARETPSSGPAVEAVTLPARNWYVIEADGQAVAACEALLEAEIIREGHGELASVRLVKIEEVSLRVTASRAQVEALKQSADALFETFNALGRLAHLGPADALAEAQAQHARLSRLCDSLDKTLAGTENPVVRGLAGLVGSCREAMGDLSLDAAQDKAQKKNASLILQYEAYVQFLSGK